MFAEELRRGEQGTATALAVVLLVMAATALFIFTSINMAELADARINMMLDAAATAGAAYGARVQFTVDPTGRATCIVDIDPVQAQAAAMDVWTLNSNNTGWAAIGVQNTGFTVEVVSWNGQDAVRAAATFKQERVIGPGGLFRKHFAMDSVATLQCQP